MSDTQSALARGGVEMMHELLEAHQRVIDAANAEFLAKAQAHAAKWHARQVLKLHSLINEIHVDRNGKCNWPEVANLIPLMRDTFDRW